MSRDDVDKLKEYIESYTVARVNKVHADAIVMEMKNKLDNHILKLEQGKA